MKHYLVLLVVLTGIFSMQAQQLDKEAVARVQQQVTATVLPNSMIGSPLVKSAVISGDTLVVDLNENFSYEHLTREGVAQLKSNIKKAAAPDFTGKGVKLTVQGADVNKFFFDFPAKYARHHEAFVSEVSPTRHYSKGLDGNIVAMWQSHGLYYEQSINCWEWQRPRLFETIEDLYPMSYVVPFVMPMLENAGCYVWNPRERDAHHFESIVDNDGALAQNGYYESNSKQSWTDAGTGFAYKKATYQDWDNPFTDGSARQIKAEKKGTASVSWDVTMPEDGNYALYISYKTLPNSVNDAKYTINASGVSRTFVVNQRMAGGVWVYLGTFPLKKGLNKNVVTLTNASSCKNGVVTADAIKVGGGMGNIARCSLPNTPENQERAKKYDWRNSLQKEGVNYSYQTSGFPRYVEGSRYFLQWAGFPDSVYAISHGLTDYADDFRSRSEWVNYLAGGSQAIPNQKLGLHVPLDLSFAFHTDAGVTYNDKIIGTQSIYRANNFGKYADGTPRIISRNLADMVNEQLVGDVRAQFDPNWTNRGLTQENLYEIRVPQVPGMLLEYLSHQNLADMKFGLDPNFLFASSRAIYKGILKWICARDHRDYVVQPLPVHSFAITPQNGKYQLTWKATVDSLESTAMPKKYLVEERIGDAAFKEIAVVETPEYLATVADNQIHGYRIVALNDGGRSFPSEVLSLGVAPNSKGQVMVVNAFTRVSAPDWVDTGDYASFTDETDHGVPYIQATGYIGSQYGRIRSVEYADSRGGFGNSRSNYEGATIAGNTFDFPAVHGAAIMNAGYSFVSSSVQAVEEGSVNLSDYKMLDIIAGKQKETPNGRGAYPSRFKLYTPALQNALSTYVQNGGKFYLSGSYVTTELKSKEEIEFGKNTLGVLWGGDKACGTGEVYSFPTAMHQFDDNMKLNYNNVLSEKQYCVESPDAVLPASKASTGFMRYVENNRTAAVASPHSVVMGFPFESLTSVDSRNAVMSQILNYLSSDKK